MPDTSNAALTVNPMVVTQVMSDGAVLMDTETGNCFELNRVGLEIWEALRRGEPAPDIINKLTRRYSLDSIAISSDVTALIEDFARNGILVVARP